MSDARTIELLEDVSEFLGPYVDIRDGSDGPRPNKAMSLQAEVEHEIARLKRQHDIYGGQR